MQSVARASERQSAKFSAAGWRPSGKPGLSGEIREIGVDGNDLGIDALIVASDRSISAKACSPCRLTSAMDASSTQVAGTRRKGLAAMAEVSITINRRSHIPLSSKPMISASLRWSNSGNRASRSRIARSFASSNSGSLPPYPRRCRMQVLAQRLVEGDGPGGAQVARTFVDSARIFDVERHSEAPGCRPFCNFQIESMERKT